MNFARLTLLMTCLLQFGLSIHSAEAQNRIGLSLPLTGSLQKLAKQFLDGANIALAEQNIQNTKQVSLVIVDDACNEDIAKLAADELIKANVSIVSGLLCNAVARVMADAFAPAKIPLLIAGARSQRLIKDRKQNQWQLWRLSPGDSDGAAFAADYFARSWAQISYAIVDDGTVYGRTIADAFREKMEEKGLKPQFQNNFRPTQSTQARLVRRLRKSGVSHVFIGAAAEDVAMIARNAKELNIPLKIVGGEVLSIMRYLNEKDRPPDGVMAILNKAAIGEKVIAPQIIDQFAKANIQIEPFALYGYQAIQVAMASLKPTPNATIYELSTKTFNTILGPVDFDQNGKNKISPYGIYRWKDQDFVGEKP